MSNNMAVVEVPRSGQACNIELVVNHIPGLHNILAKVLSRWQGTDLQVKKLHQVLPQDQWIPVHIDLTKLNETI